MKEIKSAEDLASLLAKPMSGPAPEPEPQTDGTPDEYRRARDSARRMLALAPQTERRMAEKLSRHGYSPKAVAFALAEVSRTGELNEARDIEHAVQGMAERQFYGRYRIRIELIKKGFSRDLVDAVDLGGYDFGALCARCAARHPTMESEKLAAYLTRRGYTAREVAAALADRV